MRITYLPNNFWLVLDGDTGDAFTIFTTSIHPATLLDFFSQNGTTDF
jgi:hypothetical protein